MYTSVMLYGACLKETGMGLFPEGSSGRIILIFVTGPMFAGKREYIRNALKMDEEAFAACAVWDVQDRVLFSKKTKLQTCSSEVFEKNSVITDLDELTELADSLAEKKIVIATEVGGGIVPADPVERAAREAAGRLSCLLADRADVVIRVICGLPQVLKGEWPLCQ